MLVGGAILGGFFFLSPDVAACAAGDLAKNEKRADGSPVPRIETYDNVADAGRFICRTVPFPRTGGLTLVSATASRSDDLQEVIEGNASAEVRLVYRHEASGQNVELIAAPSQAAPGVRLQEGTHTTLEGGETAIVWEKDRLNLRLRAALGPDLTQQDLDAIYDSIR